MPLTARVKEILSWYPSDNPGTKANLARMLMTGTLSGTGKMVILPVDQGFEHGPQRSFASNPAGNSLAAASTPSAGPRWRRCWATMARGLSPGLKPAITRPRYCRIFPPGPNR